MNFPTLPPVFWSTMATNDHYNRISTPFYVESFVHTYRCRFPGRGVICGHPEKFEGVVRELEGLLSIAGSTGSSGDLIKTWYRATKKIHHICNDNRSLLISAVSKMIDHYMKSGTPI